MKKFLSLVLALVMVLSLTTVAWGAAKTVYVKTDFTGTSDGTEAAPYTTLADAVSNAVAGDTVKLLGNVDLGTTGVTVSKKLIFDLGAFTITSAATSYGTVYVGTAGDLTINATTGGITNTAGNAIGNYGVVVINGGTFTGDYALYNFYYNTTTFGTATINGGTFRASSGTLAVANCGDLTVAGGSVESLDSSAVLDVTGGTIEELAVTEPDYAPPVTETTISDGTVESLTVEAAVEDSIAISGGSFGDPASAEPFLADGLILSATGTVVALPTTPHIPSGGATLAPSFEVRGEAQYKSWDAKVSAKKAEDTKDEEFATYEIEMFAKVDGAPIWWASGVEDKGEDVDFVWNNEKAFVKVVDADHAAFVIVDGKTITYFAPAEAINEAGWEGKAVKVELPVMPLDNADVKCNTLYADSALTTTYYYYDEVLYRAFDVDSDNSDDMVILNVGGAVFFGIATEADNGDGYTYTGHTLQYETSTVTHNTTGLATVTKVYCEDCKATFKFVQAPATVANGVFGDENYQRVEDNAQSPYYNLLWMEKVTPAIPGVSSAIGGNYIPVGGSSSSSTSTDKDDKVTSAETFDAGIAMYVGMSVMAAAGSAVVLKKRED